MRGHFLVMLPVALLTAAVGIAIGRWSSIPVGHALLALAWTSPIILLSWLLRRAFYVELQPVWATFGGILYLAAMLGLLFAAHSIRILSAVTALALMSGASLIASLFLIARLRPRWHSGSDGIKSSEVATFHWRYGRWSVAAAAVAWIPVNIYYLRDARVGGAGRSSGSTGLDERHKPRTACPGCGVSSAHPCPCSKSNEWTEEHEPYCDYFLDSACFGSGIFFPVCLALPHEGFSIALWWQVPAIIYSVDVPAAFPIGGLRRYGTECWANGDGTP